MVAVHRSDRPSLLISASIVIARMRLSAAGIADLAAEYVWRQKNLAQKSEVFRMSKEPQRLIFRLEGPLDPCVR